MKNTLNLIRIIITLIFTLILYYVELPALNLTDPSFYVFIFLVLICYLLTGNIKLIDFNNIFTKCVFVYKK